VVLWRLSVVGNCGCICSLRNLFSAASISLTSNGVGRRSLKASAYVCVRIESMVCQCAFNWPAIMIPPRLFTGFQVAQPPQCHSGWSELFSYRAYYMIPLNIPIDEGVPVEIGMRGCG